MECYPTNIEEKTLEYNNVIKYIFTQNHENKRILLNLDKAKTDNELFICCLDIFCKGLVYMHEYDSRVILNDLTTSHIQDTIDRLSMTGIMTIIEILQNNNTDSTPTKTIIQNNINVLSESSDNVDISKLHFDMIIGELIYRIRFQITCI